MTSKIFTTALACTILFGAYCQCSAAGPIRKRLFPSNNLPTTSHRSGGTQIPGGRIVDGTKKVLSGTRDRLMFWKDDKAPRRSSEFIEGTGRFFRPDLVRQEQEADQKRFSFVRPASWFDNEPEPDPPQSVHDWIGQPRPGFE